MPHGCHASVLSDAVVVVLAMAPQQVVEVKGKMGLCARTSQPPHLPQVCRQMYSECLPYRCELDKVCVQGPCDRLDDRVYALEDREGKFNSVRTLVVDDYTIAQSMVRHHDYYCRAIRLLLPRNCDDVAVDQLVELFPKLEFVILPSDCMQDVRFSSAVTFCFGRPSVIVNYE